MRTSISTIAAALLALSLIPGAVADRLPQQLDVTPANPEPGRQRPTPSQPPADREVPPPQAAPPHQSEPPPQPALVPGTRFEMPTLGPSAGPEERAALIEQIKLLEKRMRYLEARALARRLRPDAVQRFEAARSLPGERLFDGSADRFGEQPERCANTGFFQGLGEADGSCVRPPAVHLSRGQLIPSDTARSVADDFVSSPGGVILQGKAAGLEWVTNVEYRPALNAYILNDRAIYFSPVPAHSAAVLARAIAYDNRIAVSIAPERRVYGEVPRLSDVAADLMTADLFLAVLQGGGPPWYRLAGGYPRSPADASHGPVANFTPLFVFKDFQFAMKDEELQLIAVNFDAHIVPLSVNKAADGGYLPDFDFLSSTRPLPANIRRAVLGAEHLAGNFDYYRREIIVDRTLAYGEFAALLRGLKEAGVNLRDLAHRIDASSDPVAPRGESGYWIAYVREIQTRNQFANWLGPPHDIEIWGDDCMSKTGMAAVDGCTQLVQLNPSVAASYAHRAAAYERSKSYAAATADWTKAIEIDPKSRKWWTGRGSAWEKVGNRQRAISDYRQALALEPLDDDARNNLKRLGVRPPPLPAGLERTLTVINSGTSPVHFLYLSSCAASGWGSDRLGRTEVLKIGRQKTFRLGGCCQDMRAVFMNGRQQERHKVDICTDPIWEVR